MKLSLSKKSSALMLGLLFSQSFATATATNMPSAKPVRKYERSNQVPEVAQTKEELIVNNEAEKNTDSFTLSNATCTSILFIVYFCVAKYMNPANVPFMYGLVPALLLSAPFIIRGMFNYGVDVVSRNTIFRLLSVYFDKNWGIKNVEDIFLSALGFAGGANLGIVGLEQTFGVHEHTFIDSIVVALATGIAGMLLVSLLPILIMIPHMIIGAPIELVVNLILQQINQPNQQVYQVYQGYQGYQK